MDNKSDGYYVAYKAIILSCILLMFIEMKFIHCHSCVMFAMKSMSIVILFQRCSKFQCTCWNAVYELCCC